MDGQQSTFIEVLRRLQTEKVKEEGFPFDWDEYVTEKGKIVVSEPEGSPRWLVTVLRRLVELARKGIDLDNATWFYFDFDWSRDANASHTFFVVCDAKIVHESCHFGSHEPLILLKSKPEDDPIWHSHPFLDEAWERYCYRKFYIETVTGQLMVLSPRRTAR
jgi:hypothetical protein